MDYKVIFQWYAYLTMALCMNVPIKFDLVNRAALVDKRFLSLTIGSGIFKVNLKSMQYFQNKKLRTLSRGLSGNENRAEIYLRIGGATADHMHFNSSDDYPVSTRRRFNVDSTSNDVEMTLNRRHVLNGYAYEFDELYKFATDMKWLLVFDLNSLQRNPDGSWNPSNAIKLIDYAVKKGYFIHYELGNEPDLYPTHRNLTIQAEQLAKDFITLKNILREKTRNQAMLVGPDVATLNRYDYFERFLSNVEEDVLDAVTFHHYYSASDNITLHNFTDVQYLDTFLKYGLKALNIISQSMTRFHPPPVWIGESSSTYGGGSKLFGESYAAGFLWLDKLGLAAQLNIGVVMRQALKGAHYCLLNKNFDPNPDYWSSALYKQLVGRTVLNVTGYLQPGREVRVYAHCINRFGGRGYQKDSIVLMILNLNPTDSADIKLPEDLAGLDVHQYLFSPVNDDLSSRNIRLNGELLKLVNDTSLPELKAQHIQQPIVIPPLRYGYFVLLNSYAPACNQVEE